MKKSSAGIFAAAAALLLYFLSEDSHQENAQPSNIPPGAAQKYLDLYSLMAKTTEQFYRVPALFTIAQGGLESGWGTSNLATQAHNHFGIKADSSWHGPVFTATDGLRYRKYNTAGESLTDHAKFLATNPRYTSAFNTTDPILFAQRVAQAGYAEDPQYFQKVSGVIRLLA